MNSLRHSGFFRGEPRVIGGVCQGLAQRYGWDVNSLRIAIVVAALFFPAVCVLYALAWVFLPEAKDGRIHVDEMLKGNFDAAIIGAILLAVFGGGTSGIALGFFHAFVWIPLFLIFPVAIVVIAVLLARPKQTGPTQGQYWSATPSTQPSYPAASSPFTPASAQGEETMPDTTPDWRTQGGPTSSDYYTFPPAPPSAAQTTHSQSPVQTPPAQSGPTQTPPVQTPFTPGSSQPQASGQTIPQSAGKRFTPFVTQPALRSRVVPRALVLCVYGLVFLALAGTFFLLYRNGYSTPTQVDRSVQIALTGAAACLLIVGIAHLIAALRDRSSVMLTILSVLGMFFAIPALLGGMAYSTTAPLHYSSVAGNIDTNADWRSDTIGSSNGSNVINLELDLSHAPDGLTKDITVNSQVIPYANIRVRDGQSIRIVTQKQPITFDLDLSGDQKWKGFDSNSPTVLTSPSWKEGQGITVYLNANQLVTLDIDETGSSVDRDPWPSAIPSPTPSAAPSMGTSPSANQSQSPSPSASSESPAAGQH